MKLPAVDVALLVDAVANSAHDRAAGQTRDELLIRVEALETLLDTVVEILLRGTTADPGKSS